MAKINPDVFTKWNNGDTLFAPDYEREREILYTAINSKYDDLDHFEHRGEYSDTETYYRKNIVKYNNALYININPEEDEDGFSVGVSGVAPDEDGSIWAIFSDWSWRGVYDGDKTYQPGDVVSDSDWYELFICLNPDTTSELGSSDWDKIISVRETISNVDDVIEGAASGNYESFTSTDGQTDFTLTSGTFPPGKHFLDVYIEGVRQRIDEDFTENEDGDGFSFTEPLDEGLSVEAWWIEDVIIPASDPHAASHKEGSYDELKIGELGDKEKLYGAMLPHLNVIDVEGLTIGDFVFVRNPVTLGTVTLD